MQNFNNSGALDGLKRKKERRVKKRIYSTFWHVLYMQLGYLRYYLLLERGIQYFPLFVHITYSIGEYTIPKQLSLLLLLHTTKTSPKMGNALHQYIKIYH